jgi:hypothetical protein
MSKGPDSRKCPRDCCCNIAISLIDLCRGFECYRLVSSPNPDCRLRGVVRFFRLLEHGCKIGEPDRGANMSHLLCKLWRQDEGQDIAE